MVTWAQKRQLTYFAVFMTIILIVVGIPFFSLFYKKPTCFDGKKNGNEQGTDCGGICVRLCANTKINPVVQWQQSFEVEPGVYSSVAYVQNPNLDARAFNVPYVFTYRDNKNAVVLERKGTTNIPPGRNFAVFESRVEIPQETGPIRTSFAFTKEVDWLTAATNTPELIVGNMRITGLSNTPSVTAAVENTSFQNLGRVNVTAIVYDTNGNAVAAAKTFIKELRKQSSEPIVFTWPQEFSGQVNSCQQPVDIVLAIDRSGSMASDGRNPPEPLTSVKNAALLFVDALKSSDKAALVSFATEATKPIDELLTNDKSAIRDSIQSIAIGTNGTQYTNVYEAILLATEELTSNRHRSDAKRAIVLLTDGIPTYPEKKDDPAYPSDRALAAARDAQSQGIEIYTIGLGKEIDDEFLKSVSGFTERYFKAPTTQDLSSVYSKIGSALCKLGPARVELIPEIVQTAPNLRGSSR